ncbi:MAG: sulfotransferase, partial [Phycisphaeraceae bacterium]
MVAESPPRRFVIYASQRSGSTWLREILASHPRIEVKGELFLHRTNEHIQRMLAEQRNDRPFWAVQ